MSDLSFVSELNQPKIDVPRVALLFARSLAYPTLNIDTYLNRLDTLAEQVRSQLLKCKTLDEEVDTLSDYLFYQQDFRGNRDDYQDPQNSYLNRVLDRKKGIPITLSLIYVTIAQHLGIPAYGIGLPGHFIVGIFKKDREILLDPFNAGLRLSTADCARLVSEETGEKTAFNPKWLQAVSPETLLARMLTNLSHAYIQKENWQMAIPVIQHLLMIQPGSDFHLRDLGYLYMYNGSLRLSAQYLEEYLRRSPGAQDLENVRTSLKIVAGRLALWN
jgi:regulator of sirC expression with transglutaminase-like and TPR domain